MSEHTFSRVISPLLSQLRKSLGIPQQQLVRSMRMSQAAIAQMEARGDLRLSTLFNYVSALNGSTVLSLNVGPRTFNVLGSKADGKWTFHLQEQAAAPIPLPASAA